MSWMSNVVFKFSTTLYICVYTRTHVNPSYIT